MSSYPQKSVCVNNYYYFYIYIFRVNHKPKSHILGLQRPEIVVLKHLLSPTSSCKQPPVHFSLRDRALFVPAGK
jgi:hypothetical protein